MEDLKKTKDIVYGDSVSDDAKQSDDAKPRDQRTTFKKSMSRVI